jgi:exonuclease SbcD
MFRFIHSADLHLDSPLKGLSERPGALAEELRGASRKALDRLVDAAIGERVQFVVLSGDIYDQDWKDYSTGLFFRSRLVKLDSAGIRVYLISGNHDAASIITRKLTLPEKVTTFSSRSAETHRIPDLPVAIHGMSFPNRSVPDNLLPRYPHPVSGCFNIGMLHTSLSGAAGHDTYAPCSVEDLVAKGYDYWALGHVHQPAIIREAPWIVFPGNIQGRHARELGARGCYLVSVDEALEVSECRWIDLDVARWGIVDVDLTGADFVEEMEARVRRAFDEAVHKADDRLLAARVILRGNTPLHTVLLARTEHFEAEIEGWSQDFGEGRIWIEQVKFQTKPLVNLSDLSQQDPLTREVVEGLGELTGTLGQFPPEIEAMLNHLPNDISQPLRESWSGEGWAALADETSQMILDRLCGKGGKP